MVIYIGSGCVIAIILLKWGHSGPEGPGSKSELSNWLSFGRAKRGRQGPGPIFGQRIPARPTSTVLKMGGPLITRGLLLPNHPKEGPFGDFQWGNPSKVVAFDQSTVLFFPNPPQTIPSARLTWKLPGTP